jgi:hypothetical protein
LSTAIFYAYSQILKLAGIAAAREMQKHISLRSAAAVQDKA